MIRALALAALLCIASVAEAGRVAIIDINAPGGTSGTEYRFAEYSLQYIRLTQILRHLGVEYVDIDCSLAAQEYCRLGAFTTSAGNVETVDAVIHLGFRSVSAQIGGCNSGYRPDSLCKSYAAMTPLRVPQLFLGTMGIYASAASAWNDAAACTTGSTGGAQSIGGQGMQCPAGYYQVGQPDRFTSSSFAAGRRRNASSPEGGLRVLIGIAPTSSAGFAGGQGPNCIKCDSMVVAATPDTMALWERPMAHVPGSKPLVFAYYGGAGPCLDSTNVTNIPCEGEYSILLAAIARIDSLCNGSLIKRPYKMGIAIRGGFSRQARRAPGVTLDGFREADSTALITSIDSLGARGIPAVLGVNVDPDSLAARPNEWNWWRRWPALKFTPYLRTGLDTTALAASAAAGWNKPVDTFGRYRLRTFYQNSTCHGNADSSVYCGIKRDQWRLDSALVAAGIGVDRASRFVMPPQDDWTPKNVGTNPRLADSARAAIRLAGATAMLINSQDIFQTPSNPRGWDRRQGWYRAGTGGRLKLLAHSGGHRMGGHSQYDQRSDSTAPKTPTFTGGFGFGHLIAIEQQRAWGGMFKTYQDADFNPPDQFSATTVGADQSWDNLNRNLLDRIVGFRRSNIIYMSAGELAGETNGPPAMTGRWVIQSLDGAMRIINRIANKSVVVWDYPENIDP